MKFTRSWLLLFDVLAVITAFLLAFAVRIPFKYLGVQIAPYMHLLLPLVALRVTLFAVFGLYRTIWARTAFREFVAVLAAVTMGSILATLLLLIQTLQSPIEVFPRLVIVYEWALTLALVAGTRYSLRLLDLRLMEPEVEEESLEHQRILKERLAEWLYNAPPDVRHLWWRSQQWSVNRALKRVLDVVVALIALVALSPVLLFIAILIKLESPGPVLADAPMRAGRGGIEFRMYKFRSMVQNAHMILMNNPELWEKYKKNNFKLLEDDPRLTRIGKFLRKTSLDELPNFINVLHGEMSLVGPRARYPFEIVAQGEHFPHTQSDIITVLSVKPGVTGPWQVSGRSRLGYEERMWLEAAYARKNSPLGDLLICLRTVPKVISKEGAH